MSSLPPQLPKIFSREFFLNLCPKYYLSLSAPKKANMIVKGGEYFFLVLPIFKMRKVVIKMADDLLTVETLCQKLQVSENTAYQLLKSGQLKGFKVGRMWRIPQSSLDSYVAKQLSGKVVTKNELTSVF